MIGAHDSSFDNLKLCWGRFVNLQQSKRFADLACDNPPVQCVCPLNFRTRKGHTFRNLYEILHISFSSAYQDFLSEIVILLSHESVESTERAMRWFSIDRFPVMKGFDESDLG